MKFWVVFFIFSAIQSCSDGSSNNEQQKKDENELEQLLQEISVYSSSLSCENPGDWKSIAIGVKACGGPQSYMPYSIKIDTLSFIKLVNDYNLKSDTYNRKYNIISDCRFVNPPTQIECRNGSPVLIYE